MWLLANLQDEVTRYNVYVQWAMMPDDCMYVYDMVLLLLLPRIVGPSPLVGRLQRDTSLLEAKIFFEFQTFMFV